MNVQVAAAPLGQRLEPDVSQAAAHPAVGTSRWREGEAFFHLTANFNYVLLVALDPDVRPW
jgi:hypothetical protein